MPESSAKNALPERLVARHYSYGEVAVLMVAFVICGVLFDSGGLMTWAGRLAVGPAQIWMKLLGPMNDTLAKAMLDRPRTMLIAEADRFSERWGPPVEAVAEVASTEPLPTASPAPLSNDIDGPLGKLQVPTGDDEVELPEFASTESSARATTSATDVRILLIGDSMMQVGLGPGISEAFARDPHVHVIRETHIGTGLSRPDVYDWPAQLAPLLFHERPRFVVATFGGNDAQDMRLSGQIIPFGTSKWDATYQARVHELMAELTRGGAEVLWVGLPPMRAEDFNERVAKLNDLVVAAAKGNPHVQFLDTAPLLTGDDHQFATYLPAPGGGLVQIRQEDGVHLSTAGGELVAEKAIRWIDSTAVTEAGTALSAPATPAHLSDPAPGG